MSRMTPSLCAPNPRATAHQVSHHSPEPQATKVLTNFSIDSIIGQHQQHEAEARHQVCETRHPGGTSQVGTVKKFRPKNFQCPVCRMAFSNNGQLKNHVRIHTGERPFQCNQSDCNKTFTRNEELTRHKLIHTGVRPHACPSCCKSFGRKDHLKKHVRTHERKRLRKRVYVPSSGYRQASKQGQGRIEDPIYSPTKTGLDRVRTSVEMAATSNAQLPRPAVLPLPIDSLTLPISYNQFNSMVPPVTLAQQLSLLGTSPEAARTMASLAAPVGLPACRTSTPIATNGTAPIQQLAGEYWHKWYSFLGLCQQQQQQQTKRVR